MNWRKEINGPGLSIKIEAPLQERSLLCKEQASPDTRRAMVTAGDLTAESGDLPLPEEQVLNELIIGRITGCERMTVRPLAINIYVNG